MVKVKEGEGKNEFILMKCTAVEPPLIIGVVYGVQENTNHESEVRDNLTELFAAIDEYRDKGCNILIGGDFNVAVGDEIPGNDPKISKGGKLLTELCKDFDLEMINKRVEGNKMTHFDASGGNPRVLDYVISNLGQEHTRIEIDHELNMTPFIPKLKRDRDGKAFRCNSYSDHRSIIGEINLNRNTDSKRKPKIRQWRMNKPGGKDKYRELTDLYADEAYNIIRNNEDTEIIFSQIQDLINKIKTESYGIKTITKKKAERESDENLLLKRSTLIKEAIEKMEMDGKRLNEQIFLSRKQFNSNDEDEVIEAMDHYKTGEHLEDPDDIIESILDYNTDVLSKNENLDNKYHTRRIIYKLICIDSFGWV